MHIIIKDNLITFRCPENDESVPISRHFISIFIYFKINNLRKNNVELSKDTLNYYLKKVLEDHKDLYINLMSARIGRNDLLKN